MPVDSRIAMGIQYPQSDIAGSFQKGFNLGQDIKDAPLNQKILEAKAQDSQLTAANNKLAAIGNLLNGVKDQNSYTMAKQQLASAGIINPADIPDVYDPAYVEMHKNSLLNAKAQLDKQFKAAEIDQMRAGGATGTLLNRLQHEPGLMDAYLGKANAGKGIVMQDGQPIVAPGYNEAVASTEGAKKAAEQQAILNAAANIESAKAEGAAAGKSLGEKQRREINAPNNLMLIQEAEKLLPQATSGLGQRFIRGSANIAGKSTESSKADRQLNVLSAALTASVPRMEGPQSDKDVAMYKQAAGDVGNPDVPYEDRLAALQTMKNLQKKYQRTPAEDAAAKLDSQFPENNIKRTARGDAAALKYGYTQKEINEYWRSKK